MRSRWWIAVVIAAAVSLIAGFTFAPSGRASSNTARSASGTRVVAHAIPAAQVKATARYWTRARMASAKPADIVRRGSPTRVSSAPLATGASGSVPGRSPSGRLAPPLNPGGQGNLVYVFCPPAPFIDSNADNVCNGL